MNLTYQPWKIIFILCFSLFIFMDAGWLYQNFDLHSFDCLIHLNNLMDISDYFEQLLNNPGLLQLKKLLVSEDSVQKNFYYLLTLPFFYLFPRNIHSPFIINIPLLILILYSLYKLVTLKFEERTAFKTLILLLSFPCFSGLCRYYNPEILLTLWFTVVVYFFFKFEDFKLSGKIIFVFLSILTGLWIKISAFFIFLPLIFIIILNYKKLFFFIILISLLPVFLYLANPTDFNSLLSLFNLNFNTILYHLLYGWFPENLSFYAGNNYFFLTLFYPFTLLKGLLFPSFILLLILSFRLLRDKNQYLERRLLFLVLGIIIIFTLIGNKRSHYIATSVPLIAILITRELERLKYSRTLFILIVSFNFLITFLLSFNSIEFLEKLSDKISLKNRYDTFTLSYYPKRADIVRTFDLKNFKQKKKNFILVNCFRDYYYFPSFYQYYLRRTDPEIKISLLDQINKKFFSLEKHSSDKETTFLLFLPESAEASEIYDLSDLCLSEFNITLDFKVLNSVKVGNNLKFTLANLEFLKNKRAERFKVKEKYDDSDLMFLRFGEFLREYQNLPVIDCTTFSKLPDFFLEKSTTEERARFNFLKVQKLSAEIDDLILLIPSYRELPNILKECLKNKEDFLKNHYFYEVNLLIPPFFYLKMIKFFRFPESYEKLLKILDKYPIRRTFIKKIDQENGRKFFSEILRFEKEGNFDWEDLLGRVQTDLEKGPNDQKKTIILPKDLKISDILFYINQSNINTGLKDYFFYPIALNSDFPDAFSLIYVNHFPETVLDVTNALNNLSDFIKYGIDTDFEKLMVKNYIRKIFFLNNRDLISLIDGHFRSGVKNKRFYFILHAVSDLIIENFNKDPYLASLILTAENYYSFLLKDRLNFQDKNIYPYIYNNLAIIREEEGDKAGSIRYLEECIKLAADLPIKNNCINFKKELQKR